jgi:hypothetical protein
MEEINDSNFGEWLASNLHDTDNDYYLLYGLNDIIEGLDNDNINKKYLKKQLKKIQSNKSSGAKLYREEIAYKKKIEKNLYKNNI